MDNLVVDVATIRVMGWLAEAGIRSILLKGGALRYWLYGDGQPRIYRDIDILVSPDQIASAADAMRARGWAASPYGSEIGHADQLSPPAGDLPIALDLHRSFHYVTVPPPLVWQLLSEHAVPLRLAGRQIETLDECGLAVIVTLHHASDGAGRMHREDLERALVLASAGVWRDAAQLATELGAADAFAAGLRDVRGGAAVADALGLPETTDPALALALLHPPPPTSAALLRLQQSGADPSRLIRILRSELLPPPASMREQYPVARRGHVGLLAAYVTRPFMLAPQLRAGWRAAATARAQARARQMPGTSTAHDKPGQSR